LFIPAPQVLFGLIPIAADARIAFNFITIRRDELRRTGLYSRAPPLAD
jgi:hypothetical protein